MRWGDDRVALQTGCSVLSFTRLPEDDSREQRRERSRRGKSETPCDGVDDFRSDRVVVKDVVQWGSLRHEGHEQRDAASRIGEQKGRGHRTHRCPCHMHPGKDCVPSGDGWAFFDHFVYCTRDVDRKVHDGTACSNEDACHEDPGEVEILVPRIEQSLSLRHDRTMEFERLCGDHC